MAELRARRPDDYEAELRRYHALLALLFSALLWVDVSLFFWNITLSLFGLEGDLPPELVEYEAFQFIFLSPIHIALLVSWAFQIRRSWKVALVGLPPALLLAYGLLTPLFLFVVEALLGW